MDEPVVKADTKLVTYGFFLDAAAHPNARADEYFHYVPVRGLPTNVQFFRVNVTDVGSAGPVEHVVVAANHPRLTDDVIAETAAAIRVAGLAKVLYFMVEASTGAASALRADGATAEGPALAAAAVSTVLACAGWDESDPIVVTVDGRVFAVSMHFHGSHCSAHVAER